MNQVAAALREAEGLIDAAIPVLLTNAIELEPPRLKVVNCVPNEIVAQIARLFERSVRR